MDPIPAAAALAAVLGAALAAVARTRIAFLAGVVSALALIPLCRAALPEATAWGLGAVAYLVGTLLGGYLLWVSSRATGPRLPSGPTLPLLAWLLLAGAAVGLGVAGWPAMIEWLDPSRAPGARAASWLEAGRWSMGAGLALLLIGLGRLLASAQPARLAAGAAFCSAAAWLMVTGLGAAASDVTLPALGLVLPAAAATAAAHSLRPHADR